MYKQLRDWMVYGHLNDKYNEFFICLDKILTNEKSATSILANNTLELDKTLLATASSTMADDCLLYNDVEDLFFGARFSSRYSQYCLNSSQLPSFIKLKTANKILFAGELLQLFKSKSLNDIYTTSGGLTGTADNQQQSNETSLFQFTLNLTVNKVQSVTDSNKCNLSRYISYMRGLISLSP
jgi:hypothetical protein